MSEVVTAGGRTIHYEEAGSGAGAPLLMIAGLGSPRGGWADAIPLFSSSYRCLAIDNRDAGESEAESAPYSIADMADDAAAFLDALGIERAHIMGSSMGGFIAQHLALNHPAKVASLILVGTSPVSGLDPIPLPTAEQWIEDPVERARQRLPMTVAPGYFATRAERLEELAAQTAGNRMTREGYGRQVTAINETHDVRSRLAEIDATTLVVHGDQDAAVPLRAGEILAEGIPGARLVVLPGVGHVPHREVPREFARAVHEFLGSD